ncbi:CAP domain-containing protein [uncultured Methanolobus sp.]|uniref:CAP domain-containing protein n=1 Tax=uncultured Methanolobus sp. TaxID=218300 RepID=UPI0029C69469|nr:CAP domain-containing protein [uncultured Methanolobus sp.]
MNKTYYLSGYFLAFIILLTCFTSFVSAEETYAVQEQQMLDLINDERLSYGLEPLTLNPVLTQVARDHSKEMIEMDYFSHNSFDGTLFSERIRDAGYPVYRIGENIAMNYPPNVVQAHENLMNSAGHRANILSSSYNEIGIGIWVGEYSSYSNTAMYTQDFGWNQNVVVTPFSIISSQPVSDSIFSNGAEQIFSIQTNELCDVSWSVGGTLVKTDEDVTQSYYNVQSLSEGIYDIEVTAVNLKGSDSVSWVLEVIPEELPQESIKGDFDGDNDVDFDDFVELAEVYNSSSGDMAYSSVFDFDGDNDVDFDDFVEFAAVYNK